MAKVGVLIPKVIQTDKTKKDFSGYSAREAIVSFNLAREVS